MIDCEVVIRYYIKIVNECTDARGPVVPAYAENLN